MTTRNDLEGNSPRRPGELTRFEACAMSACFGAGLILCLVFVVWSANH